MIETVNCGGSAPDGAGFLFLPGPVPILYQAGEIQLAEGLIGYRRHGVGQVQAAGLLSHGEADAALGVPLQQRRRQPGRLFPEKEPAAVPVRRVAVPARRPGGGEPQVRLGIPGKKSSRDA